MNPQDSPYKNQRIIFCWEETEPVQSYTNTINLRIRRFVLTEFGEVYEMIVQYQGFGQPTITYIDCRANQLPKAYRP